MWKNAKVYFIEIILLIKYMKTDIIHIYTLTQTVNQIHYNCVYAHRGLKRLCVCRWTQFCSQIS